jgi:ribose transport system permease protein
VLNIGSIDLSNAAVALLGALVMAIALPPMGLTAYLVVLLLVTVIGAINGAVIGYAQVPSFALTLGTLAILQTAALIVSGADTIYVSENRELISTLYEKQILNAPLTFWIGILFAVSMWVLLRYTVLGQNMTAMGKNELGATLSAVPTRKVRIIAYALSGFMGGLAGLSIVAQAGSASASGLGSDLLLPGIAAALIGGTSISGGQTNPLNVIFGGLTVAFVPIAIQAMGLGAQAQSLVYGIFIILVVALTTVRSRESVIK